MCQVCAKALSLRTDLSKKRPGGVPSVKIEKRSKKKFAITIQYIKKMKYANTFAKRTCKMYCNIKYIFIFQYCNMYCITACVLRRVWTQVQNKLFSVSVLCIVSYRQKLPTSRQKPVQNCPKTVIQTKKIRGKGGKKY